MNSQYHVHLSVLPGKEERRDFELIVQLLDKFFAVMSLRKQKFPLSFLPFYKLTRQDDGNTDLLPLRVEHFTTIL
jgi:hypothetical protein